MHIGGVHQVFFSATLAICSTQQPRPEVLDWVAGKEDKEEVKDGESDNDAQHNIDRADMGFGNGDFEQCKSEGHFYEACHSDVAELTDEEVLNPIRLSTTVSHSLLPSFHWRFSSPSAVRGVDLGHDG